MIFARVAKTGSFTAAAAELGLGRSVVSSHISQLERNLDKQLLIRSTRSLALTSQGEILFESCGRIWQEIEAMQQRLESHHSEATGNIRMSCSVNLGIGVFCEIVAGFQQEYPNISVEMMLEDRMVDVVGEQFDFAVRTGWKDDGRLRSFKLPTPRILICASREWVAQNPVITAPEDLSNVRWVQTSLSSPTKKLRLKDKAGVVQQVDVTPVFSTNAGLAAKLAIIAGAGVGLLPGFAIETELQSGVIIPMLPDWVEEQEHPLSIVVPNQKVLPHRVQLLIDFIKRRIDKAHLAGEKRAGANQVSSDIRDN